MTSHPISNFTLLSDGWTETESCLELKTWLSGFIDDVQMPEVWSSIADICLLICVIQRNIVSYLQLVSDRLQVKAVESLKVREVWSKF